MDQIISLARNINWRTVLGLNRFVGKPHPRKTSWRSIALAETALQSEREFVGVTLQGSAKLEAPVWTEPHPTSAVTPQPD